MRLDRLVRIMEVVTQPARWEPDQQMVAAVLSMPKASRRLTELSLPDRAWLVAGLTLAGMTSEDIAARTRCSPRLVKSIRAEDMTQVCKVAMVSMRQADADHYATRSELSIERQETTRLRRENDRLRAQLNLLVDKLAVGEPIRTCVRNHPLVGDNVYRHRGRDHCRECNRENVIRYRRKQAEQQGNAVSMSTTVHIHVVASA